jgi:hypothetical protein
MTEKPITHLTTTECDCPECEGQRQYRASLTPEERAAEDWRLALSFRKAMIRKLSEPMPYAREIGNQFTALARAIDAALPFPEANRALCDLANARTETLKALLPLIN